jgi:hypothetical protein
MMKVAKQPRLPFTVRKVTDNHWSLVYMNNGPAISESGVIYRFLTEAEALEVAQALNARESRSHSPDANSALRDDVAPSGSL